MKTENVSGMAPEWFTAWAKEFEAKFHPRPRNRFHCAGAGVDFETIAIPPVPPAPFPANGFVFSDDDHVSGPPPTPTRIVVRAGYQALHCGYLMVIRTPPAQRLSLVYFDGGGIIDVFDNANVLVTSRKVANALLPTTETFASAQPIGRLEIRSANEMYLLQICCDVKRPL